VNFIPSRRHAVDVRRLDLVAKTADIGIAEVIDEDDHHIRRPGSAAETAEMWRQEGGKQQAHDPIVAKDPELARKFSAVKCRRACHDGRFLTTIPSMIWRVAAIPGGAFLGGDVRAARA
jgi:hypothetical protein